MMSFQIDELKTISKLLDGHIDDLHDTRQLSDDYGDKEVSRLCAKDITKVEKLKKRIDLLISKKLFMEGL